jgi:hypothetical protein
VNSEEASLTKVRISFESIDHDLCSYFVLGDRFVDCSSTQDNKQNVSGIEDAEHRCDQIRNKHCVNVHTKQVQNKVYRERRRYHCQWHLSYEDNHTHHSSNIDHTEQLHDRFESSLEL